MNDTTPGGKPNIRQVAAVAGVSHMTVSRVLNDHPNIKESTRKKVLEVIEQLNYRPNIAARALATQKNRRIGVMIESAREFGPLYTLRAVEDAARQWGFKERPIVVGDWSADFGYDFVRSMKRKPEYTAIFAANDSMALGLLHGVHDLGVVRRARALCKVDLDLHPGEVHTIGY